MLAGLGMELDDFGFFGIEVANDLPASTDGQTDPFEDAVDFLDNVFIAHGGMVPPTRFAIKSQARARSACARNKPIKTRPA